jgi:hypothetical protein
MTNSLPKFRDWTIDSTLEEFRRVRLERNAIIDLDGRINEGVNRIVDFIPFNSPAGRVMLRAYRAEGSPR